MERAAALKTIGKMLGKSMGYRIDPKAATRDEREAARLELVTANAERAALKEQREARHKAILAADAEYQRLDAAYSAARERADRLFGITRHHKITVGTTNSMFFHVKAEGDSWEDVIAKLEKAG